MNEPDRPLSLSYASPGTARPRRTHWALWALAVGLLALVGTVVVTPSHTHVPSVRASVRCAAHLMAIGQGIMLYANAHNDKCPERLGDLLMDDYTAPGVLVCPSSTDTPARLGPTTQATADTVNAGGHFSYTYLGRGQAYSRLPPSYVLAYESPINHGSFGMNVLFDDRSTTQFKGSAMGWMLMELASGHNPPRNLASLPASKGR